MAEKGKVWLVGAGPSDAGLLTLKGKHLIEQADVVVYDALVSAAVLSLIPASARAICVGKRAGNHPVPQPQINEILLEEAMKGNHVVRLKGGDPFLFGRGGEELELLIDHDIPYEIVPGVTSAISVPAYNGIPVTHRDFCSSVHIITAHSKKDGTLKINFRALTELEGTLVFLMGVTSMKMICDGLMEKGMSPEMPAAVLQQGTGATQRRVVSDLAHLTEQAHQANIQAPAVLVIGKVCSLAEHLSWTQNRCLDGVRVVLTRPKELISRMSQSLSDLGAEVIELPSICLKPYEENSDLLEALKQIKSYQWLTFTSVSGVKFFFQFLKKNRIDVRTLFHLHIAVIGSGTEKELENHGFFADFVPEQYDAQTLAQGLCERMNTGERVLVPRAKIGSEDLPRILEENKIAYRDIPIYDTVFESHNAHAVKALAEKKEISCAVFTSASTVHGFAKTMSGISLSDLTAACIGEKTAQAAQQYGMKTIVSEKATIDSLTQLLVDHADRLRLNRE